MSPRFTSNLQAVRILAAYLILLRHSFILFMEQSPLAEVVIPPIGIWIFFAISGYLLPGSWQRRPLFFTFMRARLERLFPSLAVVVFASALILGPWLSYLSPLEYFRHPQTWQYFLNLLLHPSYFLPGVFGENYYPNAVNGSLWSLPPQFIAYALIPVIFMAPKRWMRIFGWILIFLIAQWDHFTGQFDEVIFWGSNLSQVLTAICLFASGALIKELKIGLRNSIALGLLVAMALGSTLLPAFTYPLLALCLPYIVLTIGLQSWPLLRAGNRLPDISYGVFLVGFPVQQTMIALFPALHPLPSISATVVVSTVLALLISRFVEQPMIQRRVQLDQAKQEKNAPTPSRISKVD